VPENADARVLLSPWCFYHLRFTLAAKRIDADPLSEMNRWSHSAHLVGTA
jgi:hypothetical protein